MAEQAADPTIPSGKEYPAEGITVWWDANRCRHFAECIRGHPAVFERGRKPWVRSDLGEPLDIADVIRRCPTGALHYRLKNGPEETPDVPTSIRRLSAGPMIVRGDLVIRTPKGQIRDTRAALCGCGETKNLPFCDGACGIDQPSGPRA
jgi:uncharacterized Fe-S cluster protein YjdI/CDGSH-type Zn-finger protein